MKSFFLVSIFILSTIPGRGLAQQDKTTILNWFVSKLKTSTNIKVDGLGICHQVLQENVSNSVINNTTFALIGDSIIYFESYKNNASDDYGHNATVYYGISININKITSFNCGLNQIGFFGPNICEYINHCMEGGYVKDINGEELDKIRFHAKDYYNYSPSFYLQIDLSETATGESNLPNRITKALNDYLTILKSERPKSNEPY